jgi:hypothetical protein
VERHIKKPEVWNKMEFAYERTYNEKTGSFTEQTIGPSGGQDVYDIPFSADNVTKLFGKVENDNVMFMLKDLRTSEAREVKWSSVKDTLDLFMHKSFDYLWSASYIPLPVKMELRQEAIAQGLIGGVASDYNMQQAPTSSTSNAVKDPGQGTYL